MRERVERCVACGRERTASASYAAIPCDGCGGSWFRDVITTPGGLTLEYRSLASASPSGMDADAFRARGVAVADQAASYYAIDLRTAVEYAAEMVEEWDYAADPHGYCHTRPMLARLMLEAAETVLASFPVTPAPRRGFARLSPLRAARRLLNASERRPR